MVRMASLPVGKNQNSGPLFADDTRDFQLVLPRILDPTIRNIESLPPGDAQYFRGLRCLLGTAFGSASRPHLTLSEIEDAGAPSALCHLQQRAPAGLFDVVAMSSDS